MEIVIRILKKKIKKKKNPKTKWQLRNIKTKKRKSSKYSKMLFSNF